MIILLGLPKSGTTSFQELFSNNGYKSVHWKINNDKAVGTIIKQNKMNNRPLLYGLTNFDCITQMDICTSIHDCYWSQIIDYQQIYQENKNAIFILNKRDPHKILRSFKNWHNLYDRIHKYNPEIFGYMKDDQKFLNFINNHYINVEEFFGNIPDAKFISYDIEADNIDKLNQYISINTNKFPNANKNY